MILGSPRSGTTLLARVIAAHPDLIVPSETDFIPTACQTLVSVPNEAAGKDIVARLVLNSPKTMEALTRYLEASEIRAIVAGAPYNRRVITDLFDALGRAAGRKLAGDKSPNNLLDIRYLHQIGLLDLDMKIIHIVRDIRDVVSSLIEQRWVDDIDRIMPRIWVESNLYVSSLLENQPNYLQIRYEDFVDHPEATAQAICKVLEVDYTDQMLDVSRRDPMYRDVNCHQNVYRPIEAGRVARFQSELDSQTLNAIERSALEGMVRFGYDSATIDPKFVAALYPSHKRNTDVVPIPGNANSGLIMSWLRAAATNKYIVGKR